MARFKLGETARRLAVLAESATDPGIRTTLLDLAEIILSEQRTIERHTRWKRDRAPDPDPAFGVRLIGQPTSSQ